MTEEGDGGGNLSKLLIIYEYSSAHNREGIMSLFFARHVRTRSFLSKGLLLGIIFAAVCMSSGAVMAEGSFFPPEPYNAVDCKTSSDVPNVIVWDGTGATACMSVKDFMLKELAAAGCKPGQKITVLDGKLKCG